jgi:mannose-1-phosphate guanylyltransferase
MKLHADRWVLVLAAGSGTRLNRLTAAGDAGQVPKQFWSLSGGASLLEETLERAFSVAAPNRVVVVVAAEHEPFWRETLHVLPAENILIQPRNCGTAIGILLGVAAVLARDSNARVVVLPSDHYVAREGVLRRSISAGLEKLETESRVISFLGIEPESADPELGYIVCGATDHGGGFHISEFIEKPNRKRARELLCRSALWNSFILVATAHAFVELIGERYPRIAATFLEAADRASKGDVVLYETLYADLPVVDFSRDIVEGTSVTLSVIPVSACGWSDLGTPRRVAECLDRLGKRCRSAKSASLSLADAHSRFRNSSTVAERWA